MPLREPRRINVAFTRAKVKLIIVGHVPTLLASPHLRALMQHVMNSEGAAVLPVEALE